MTIPMYFRYDHTGTKIVQESLYINRKKVCDFDWGHSHTNKNGDGQTFPEGTVHVQFYGNDGNADVNRAQQDARYMTHWEATKYGPIIKHFCENVNLGPNIRRRATRKKP